MKLLNLNDCGIIPNPIAIGFRERLRLIPKAFGKGKKRRIKSQKTNYKMQIKYNTQYRMIKTIYII